MIDATDGQVFTVTDIKQFAYCPRIVAYTYCLPLLRPTTYKMDAGIQAHEEAGRRERRRTLAAYGLSQGERHFDIWLASDTLGLRGRLDMVIDLTVGGERELIPVEYKQSARKPGRHFLRQLAAYGMMLEECWGGSVHRGFVYSLVRRRAEEIRITDTLRREVTKTIHAMREIVSREMMPHPPKSRRGCVNCEFRRFCNDVL